jgi:hypothetical protein
MGLPVTRLFWKYPGTGDLSVGECPKIVRGRKSVGCVGLMDNHRHARTRTGICHGTYTSYTAGWQTPSQRPYQRLPTVWRHRPANLLSAGSFPRPGTPLPSPAPGRRPSRCGSPRVWPRTSAGAGSAADLQTRPKRKEGAVKDSLSTLGLDERPGQCITWIRRVPHYQTDGALELRPGERPFAAGPHHDAYVCMVESSVSVIALRPAFAPGGAKP